MVPCFSHPLFLKVWISFLGLLPKGRTMAGYCWWRQDASKGLGSDDELSIYSVPGTLLDCFQMWFHLRRTQCWESQRNYTKLCLIKPSRLFSLIVLTHQSRYPIWCWICVLYFIKKNTNEFVNIIGDHFTMLPRSSSPFSSTFHTPTTTQYLSECIHLGISLHYFKR